MQFTMYKALKQLLLIDWAHRHTRAHTQNMWWPRPLFGPSAREGRRAEGKSLHLHLSASCGLVELVRWWDSNPPPQRSTKHQGRRVEQRTPASTKADEARDDEATGDKGRKKLPRIRRHQARQTQPASSPRPFFVPLVRWEGFLPWPLAS